MKLFLAFAMLVASTVAEPPVNNRYLPPQRGLSQNYGAPSFGQRHTDAVFRAPNNQRNQYRPQQPSPQYGAPINQPANQYLPSLAQPSNQFGSPNSAQLSRNYGAPNSAQPSRQYGVPNSAQPSGQYGVPNLAQPSNQYGAPSVAQPSTQYLPSLAQPSRQYGAPRQSQDRLSQEYGTPEEGISGDVYQSGVGSYRAPEQSRQYLPPGGRGYDDGSNGEPANYNFEYMVKDDASGNDFGHRESRQGDRAEGLYYVLLPDGRKQTVEYEADQAGYRPRISYEDTGAGLNGYGRNQAYENQGGPY